MRLMTPKIARKSPKMETNCASQSLRNAGSANTSRRLGLGAAAAVAIFVAIVLQFAAPMRQFPEGPWQAVDAGSHECQIKIKRDALRVPLNVACERYLPVTLLPPVWRMNHER